jgi:hypothetical protein
MILIAGQDVFEKRTSLTRARMLHNFSYFQPVAYLLHRLSYPGSRIILY